MTGAPYSLVTLTGACAVGDAVVCNTTAVDRALGTDAQRLLEALADLRVTQRGAHAATGEGRRAVQQTSGRFEEVVEPERPEPEEQTLEPTLRPPSLDEFIGQADLKEKIQWTIDRHKIPLDIKDVEIVYDPEEKMLGVYAEYDVYVTFPGYVHHYFFQPYAEVYADDN